MSVVNTRIVDNVGGGIHNDAGTLTIDQSVFTANQAVAGDGGSVGVAVTLPGGISATLLGVAGGGGIWNDGGSVSVSDSSLSNNLVQGTVSFIAAQVAKTGNMRVDTPTATLGIRGFSGLTHVTLNGE